MEFGIDEEHIICYLCQEPCTSFRDIHLLPVHESVKICITCYQLKFMPLSCVLDMRTGKITEECGQLAMTITADFASDTLRTIKGESMDTYK